MQNRERGAAYINIYFFLVLLVVFLGTLWFGYLQLSKVNDLQKQAQQSLQAELKSNMRVHFLMHYVEEISATFGETGEWTGKKDFKYVARFQDRYEKAWGEQKAKESPLQKPSPLAGVCLPSKTKGVLGNLAKALGLNAGAVTPIGTFLGQISEEHTRLTNEVAKAVSDAKVAQAQTATVTTKYNQDSAAQSAKHAKMQGDYTKNTNDLVQTNVQKEARLQTAFADVKKTNEEKAEMQLTHADTVKDFQKKQDRDRGQLAHYVARDAIRQPPQLADGSVISASMVANRGWIDIGKKDMLFRGTKFRILNAAGTKVKGYGEVIDTKQDRAELRLYDVKDRIGDPIVHGDQIYNDLYSPNMKRNVAMIGRFSYPYTKPMIRKLLERLGNKVHDEVKVGVDLVIVGLQDPTAAGDALKPIEETTGYKEAQVLHCEIITIAKIRDLLQLSDN